MQQSIPRSALLSEATSGLEEAPTVALLGARQVGKTTLARQVAAAWPGQSTVFDLEVAAVREALSQTPETLLRNSEGLVVIDEVQRLPALFQVLRPVCDDPNRKAVFLLLGSASWDLIQGISETLAGRILFVDVGGFSLEEVGAGAPGQALDAWQLPACVAGAVGGGVEAVDAVVHAHVSGAGHPRAGFQGVAGSAGPLLAHAGALSRANLERCGTGAFHGCERYGGEPLPRPAGRYLYDSGLAAVV